MDLAAQVQLALGEWRATYEAVRGIFIVLNIILLGVFAFSFIKALPFRPKLHPEHGTMRKTYTLEDADLKERWAGVMKKIASDAADTRKLAVIEADKIVDDALKRLGLEGDHMADRLEQIGDDEVRTLSHLWRAHRVRNNLVHAPGFELTAAQARAVIADFEAFLREIKLLQ